LLEKVRIKLVTVSLSNGTSFTANAEESILNAASKAGINLPYSCKTGRCSTCKCKVISGETKAAYDELGLSAQEKEEGWVLSCVRMPFTDVVLDLDDLGDIEIPSPKMLPCRIHAIEKLTDEIVSIKLRLPPTAHWQFLSGQYVDIIGPNALRRSYSVACAQVVEHVIELHIREVAGGALSEYWFHKAQVNDLLRLNGPLGTFFLRNSAGMDVVFFATGTGIAPVKSMLESMAGLSEASRPRSVSVYWGGRVSSDIYWNASELGDWLQFIPVLSRAGDEWQGATGYIQDVYLASQPNLDQTVVYACGSDSMIHSAKEKIVQAGLPAKRFLSDAFVCSANT
jgi:CDP-4-dehydro-6-deoxyglucose reductase